MANLNNGTGETNQVDPKRPILPSLSPDQQAKARELSKQLDGLDQEQIINYGSDIQKEISDFSQNVLNQVSNKELGSIGDNLRDLVVTIGESKPEELAPQKEGLILKIFGRVRRSVLEIQAKYEKVGEQIDKAATQLSSQWQGLMNDNKMLEGLYQKNLDYYNQLNLYIAGAEVKEKDIRDNILTAAQKRATKTQNQLDAQTVQDVYQTLTTLEKRNYDLKLTRQIAIQQAPQIRLVQTTNRQLSEKIQSSINTAIPLWKNQIAIALTLFKQRDAVNTQKAVSETTNHLLEQNSEMLKQSSLETAKESGRGVVDIGSLKKSQQNLIDTIQQTIQIQNDGRERRASAENDLLQLEDQMKSELKRISNNRNSTGDLKDHKSN
ncbi:toxic anion resistance protein [Oenococcus oeni]|uniref:Tellurite resistance protein n=7 Tax=Oenococcus oeni TaxID=1247 RepID=Q04DG2_OENOB|nr:toxic anion resistance protein [Oenococcus oeni]ABJ57510.1 Tellurite resistance protein [Oenococcus oeni PSU-1]KGH82214.1 tellurite resistance protein TelA [Oenococcus oeni S14]OIK67441.1 toxic anion resistance protein [Oenococcus oeni]OIL13400.1 toxic anion resistance protein [Oenococcus oeni]OIL27046.1 toxic anion resistance protein [Oenococcus oeni]